MRCPYCGGLNPDKTSFCVRCGRDVKQQPLNQRPPAQAQRTVYPPTSSSTSRQPISNAHSLPPRPLTPPTPSQPVINPQPVSKSPKVADPYIALSTQTNSVKEPEAPTPFPPKTIEQLSALEQGSQSYTQIDMETSYGKKKIVRIAYQKCASWQQTATLLKALKQFDEKKFDTIVIQGVFDQESGVYNYTNGQLIFDRNARLGSQILKRYQIETGNGFSSDSVRFVVTE